MSRSLKMICPSLGESRPDMRLNSVVLPAPFGPMSAISSPSWTDRSTRSTATSPPNLRDSCRVCRTTLFPGKELPPFKLPPDEADDTVRRGKDENHDDEARNDPMILEPRADVIGQADEKGRPEDRALDRPRAPDDRPHDRVAGDRPVQEANVRESRGHGVEAPSESGEYRRDDEDDQLVPLDVVSDEAGPVFVLADRDEDL